MQRMSITDSRGISTFRLTPPMWVIGELFEFAAIRADLTIVAASDINVFILAVPVPWQ